MESNNSKLWKMKEMTKELENYMMRSFTDLTHHLVFLWRLKLQASDWPSL
jgi:hypothetical protein